VKTKQLRTFLEEFLATQGATAEPIGENLLKVRFPRRLTTTVGVRDLVLAFNLRGVQEDPHSELGTVGNPLFERILELARQAGRVGERFQPVPSIQGSLPDPRSVYRIPEGALGSGEPEPTYTPLYYLLFRTEYSLEEQADELEIVPVDGISHQTLPQTPELTEYWERLSTEPVKPRAPRPAFPLPQTVLKAGMAMLERRLRRRLARIRRDSEAPMERETESIGNYYRQLIEETRNSSRRWTLTPAQREDRIRLLQLDWKRRIEEAQQAWRPRIDVTLTSVAAAQLPRLAFTLKPVDPAPARSSGARAVGAKGRAGPRPTRPAVDLALFWDETDQRFVDPCCARCGSPGLKDLNPTAEGILCPACAAERAALGPAALTTRTRRRTLGPRMT